MLPVYQQQLKVTVTGLPEKETENSKKQKTKPRNKSPRTQKSSLRPFGAE